MKKGMIAILFLLGLIAIFYMGSTLRCKSLAKDAAGRIGYSFFDGCYIELSGSKVPLK
jgi:hypothetical protein